MSPGLIRKAAAAGETHTRICYEELVYTLVQEPIQGSRAGTQEGRSMQGECL